MVTENLVEIENITFLSDKSLNSGVFLCLFGTDKIPSHLGLIADGKYYSASAKGSRIGEELHLILRKVKQSELPSLFVQLNVEIDFGKLIFSFKKYPKLTGNQTCLSPIRDYLMSIGFDMSQINFVYELIPFLAYRKLILHSFSLNMNTTSFEMATYTKQDILNRIIKLQETC